MHEIDASVMRSLEPFTIRPYRMKRLKPYQARMMNDNLNVLHDDSVSAVLEAQGYYVSENPRSIYRVDKLFQALAAFAPHKVPAYTPSDDVTAGISLAWKCFAKPHDRLPLDIMPLVPGTIETITSNPSGSAGLTSYGCTKAASKTRALERGLQTLRKVKQPEPCLAFKRTQFNDKTRLVWGYPYSMTVIEGLVAYPLIQRFKRGTTPMAFAMPSGALGTKLRVASYHKKYAYSIDMSQFDANVGAKLIHIAFKILKTWFKLDQVEPTSGCTVREVFDLIEHYFIHTTIVMPDLRIYIGKDHGVPSGSFFTQMIDSVVNVIMAGSISSRFNLNIDRHELFVLGDDLLFWSNRKMDLDHIAQWVRDNLHLIMHGSEKSKVYRYDEAIHFLGRDWSNGLPDLDEDGILARMVYPESFRRYSRDPETKRKQIRMMILSYAATYRKAWRIAYDLLDGSGRNIHKGCANLDRNTYYIKSPVEEVDPDHLSGLQRFRIKYLYRKVAGDIPITATQYWL